MGSWQGNGAASHAATHSYLIASCLQLDGEFDLERWWGNIVLVHFASRYYERANCASHLSLRSIPKVLVLYLCAYCMWGAVCWCSCSLIDVSSLSLHPCVRYYVSVGIVSLPSVWCLPLWCDVYFLCTGFLHSEPGILRRKSLQGSWLWHVGERQQIQQRQHWAAFQVSQKLTFQNLGRNRCPYQSLNVGNNMHDVT